MIQEKSCVAVIYSMDQGQRLYLIEHMIGGHYAMCKGHVENDESEEETAIREIREETGLRVRLNTSFRETVSYSPADGHMKDVVYFIGTCDTRETVNQIEEVRDICWLPYEEALQKLTFENDREVLRKAEKWLKGSQESETPV